ncbi:MAG: AarF/ABC1/UbiB kinase family protein [Candidatus Brocadiae bacterium]|nr:AarF/ABC1/UbiB kinase family protein [Candidatus Brocadiia bacterium]
MRISSILKGPRRVRRVVHIVRKAASHGLGFLVSRIELQRYLPTWVRLPTWGRQAEPEELASEFASVLEELGPTFVKFGQMLATRPDILPPDYIHELERIYHHVAPFSAEVSRGILADELGSPVETVYRDFSDEPRASGSIAQVHDATLHDGTPVVVKVRRPRIEQVAEDDVAILTFLAAQADKVEEFQPFRFPMLVEEFARAITQELDFISEAAYTHKFRERFKDDARIQIPEVYWDYTSERVLTMQRMTGVHLSELFGDGGASVDKSEIARTIMDAYLRQFFTQGVFHGDPHPGNILITDQGRIALIDFGLVGRVSAELRRKLGICLIALGGGQLELVAEVLSEIGRLPDESQADELREELVGLLDRHSSVPLDKLDLQRSFLDVMGVIRKYRVQVARDFVLMGRALVAISGIVTRLDPDLDIASLAAPYGGKLLREKLAPSSVRRSLTTGGYHLGTLLTEGPRELRRLVRKLQSGMFEFTVRHEGFEKGLTELDQTGNRLSLSVILAAIILASSVLLDAEIGAVNILGWDVSLLGLLGLAFGSVLGLWLVVGILRSGRL